MLKCRNFISKFNLVNGKMEWCLLDEFYDYKYEIQSSGYADMLNDSDRNSKYYKALRKVICEMKMKGKRVHVLDIGCGSGILSMMALRLGADKVTACESFEPMYQCAQRVINDNGLFNDRIEIINSSSMELKVGVNMSEKANVLVSEIFDSELIGEGVLTVFDHAINNLLSDNAYIIPKMAKLFVQPVTSKMLRDHNTLKEPKYLLRFPQNYYVCKGYSSGYDMQASSLQQENTFKVLAPPKLVKVLHFNKESSDKDDILVELPFNGDGFVFWWQLVMTEDDEDVISTAPSWTFDNSLEYKWRDHWLQVVLYPSGNKVQSNQWKLCQNENSIWIGVDNDKGSPRCTCGIHTHITRSRLCQLNSAEYGKYVEQVADCVDKAGVRTCAVISDFSYLPLAVASRQIATSNIISHDPIRHVTQSFFSESNVTFLSPEEDISDEPVDAVIGDPFFVCSIFPWDDVHFWYGLDKIRHRITDQCLISPRTMTIKMMLVQFDHLHKIATPVRRAEGFIMDEFDDLIRSEVDNDCDGQLHLESKFLWEYAGQARSDVTDLISVDLTRSVGELISHGTVELTSGDNHRFHRSQVAAANGLVLWTVWEVLDRVWIDNSLERVRADGGYIAWKPYTRQAVHFLGEDDRELTVRCGISLEKAHFKFTMVR